MADDPRNRSTTEHLSLVDAAYEVALDPARYDELVEQWHHELTQVQNRDQRSEALSELDQRSPVADHFHRASTILERVQQADWQANPAQFEQSPVSMPEILLSRSGVVLQANFGATALLSARAGQALKTLDITPAAQETLLGICRDISSRSAASRLLRISRSGDDRPLVVMLSPATFANKTVLALRCAEIVWPETLGPVLAKAFDLTAAECEIVQSLVAGHNTTKIAESRGTSIETVRTQLRQLLAKTGTHSQLELIRMMIGFSMMSQQAEARTGQQANVQNQAPDQETDQATAKSTVHRLADGTDFELVQYGPDNGSPILVFHDEVIGDGFVPPLLREAPGYRWLVAVRPGFGASSQRPTAPDGQVQEVQSCVAAFDEVLTALLPNLPAAPLLAHGNGVFFACQFAQAYQNRCTSITALAASLPGDRGENDKNRYAAFMAGMSRLAPSMLRFAVQAGFAMYARVGSKRFLEKVYGSSTADMEVINSPVCLADLELGGRLTLAQGYRGFYYDEQTLVADWSEQFTLTPVPIRLLLGDQDQPTRRYRAEVLHKASNTVELIELDNCGFFAAFSASKIAAATLFSA